MAQQPQSVMQQPTPGAVPVPATEPPLPQLATPPQDSAATAAPEDQDFDQIGAAAPVDAADSDIIEVEWVEKAKRIVADTHDDPYQQVQQLNVLKAEYMQKRYNKAVKLPDA